MAIENITLNIIPTGDTPSIHVAQFDVDRPFNVTLKEGEDDFTPTDYDIELQVRKVDSTIVTVVPSQTTGNVVTFGTTEQMTACSGTNIAELQLTKDSQTFATLHFYLVVQRDVLAGGVTSESDIYNLTEQIAAIVPEVIGDDYYNKEEVDDKIAEIPTFDPTNYYDKSDVDTLLNGKADVSDLPDMTNYYDKSETDALLDDKANVSDLPDMTNYYTKSEVDTKITDLYQIKTASDDIVYITDGGNDIPVKSFECAIGSNGFSQADIVVGSKNLLENEATSGTVGTITFTVNADKSITVNGSTTTQRVFLVHTNFSFNADLILSGIPLGSGLFLNVVGLGSDSGNGFNFNGSVARNIQIVVPANSTIDNVTVYPMVRLASIVDDTYDTFNSNTYTVEFGSTFNDGILIYKNGGWSIDVSGTITPVTSSTRIKTISGENYIFSNTGACEVGYFTNKSDGIAELIKAFM